ncbi:MAG: cache domain-containing protein [Pseudomonadota bacterium]|nr:cache domain-containing protein [Pseudomonadota bacterium]
MTSLRAFLANLTIGNMLTAAGAMFLLGLAVVGVTTELAFRQVGVGGAIYQSIVAGKDLLGDVLPPPEYAIEPFLEANLIYNGQGKLADHKARLAALRKEFDARRAYWRASPLPADLKSEIVDRAAEAALAMWAEIDGDFLSAATAGDPLDAAFQRVARHYVSHRAIIDDVVAKANAYVERNEKEATAQAGRAMAIVLGLTAFIALALIAGFVSLRRGVAQPVAGVADRLAALAARTGQYARATQLQMRLDANLAALRGALAARGAARVVGDKLYFGDYLVNRETEIVDDIKRRFGGVATVFLGDVRVATNVASAAGARAVGTKLARGPVYDKMFGEGAMFQGQTEILGQDYVTIYEPILQDDRTIGAIFVGVPLSEAAGEATVFDQRNEVARMLSALDVVDTAIEQKNEIEREALSARYRVADEARRGAARSAAAAAGQRVVVASLTQALERLAQNDLTHRIAEEFPSEYRALKVNFERAAQTLSQTIGAVVVQGRSILEVSAEISAAAGDLSQRSEQQAANLEETSAALNEITTSSKQASEGAAHARSVVASADSDAARSAGVVDETIAAMREIADSAGKIGQIVGLIDEIAFQTNLLALNAGVEAARAGDAGRGFAVVAQEVRALALRAAQAAKDIRTLISTSTEGVKQGVDLVSRTGVALKRIVDQVGQLSGIVGDIANGSKAQASGLAEVNSAIRQMDQLTQANAAVAQRSAETAKTLESEAEQLGALVGRFQIAQETRRARAA